MRPPSLRHEIAIAASDTASITHMGQSNVNRTGIPFFPCGGKTRSTVIAMAGIALLMLHEFRIAPVGGSVLLGLILTFAAILCASIANVLQSGQTAREQSVVVLLAWAMLIGAVSNAAYAWATQGPPVIDWSARYLLGVGYLGLVGSVLTFPLYSILLRDWGPGRAAYNGVLIPVVAMALSTLFEGYHWTALALGGALVVVAGLLVALSGRR